MRIDPNWDGPKVFDVPVVLVKEIEEARYCSCPQCEGCLIVTTPLPQEEWYWRPLVRRIDFSDMELLEPDTGGFTKFLEGLV